MLSPLDDRLALVDSIRDLTVYGRPEDYPPGWSQQPT